jgi:tetratricopeptide (TPR) repeat protein
MGSSGWAWGIIGVLSLPVQGAITIHEGLSHLSHEWTGADRLKTTVKRLSRTPAAFTYRAMVYYASRAPLAKIVRVLDKALAVDPGYIPALFLEAYIVAELGKPGEATLAQVQELFGRLLVAWMVPAQQIQPGVSSTTIVGGYTSETREFDIGSKQLSVALREVLINFAKSLYESGKLEEALEHLLHVQRLDEAAEQRSWMVSYNIARCLFDLTRFAESQTFAIQSARYAHTERMRANWENLAMLLEWRATVWNQFGHPECVPVDQLLAERARQHVHPGWAIAERELLQMMCSELSDAEQAVTIFSFCMDPAVYEEGEQTESNPVSSSSVQVIE